MSGVLLWLAALVVGSALLTWGLRREHARIEREARVRTVTVTFEVIDRLTPALRRMSEQMATMVPAAARAGMSLNAFTAVFQAAAEDQRAMDRLNAQIRAPKPPAAQSGDGGDAAAGEA